MYKSCCALLTLLAASAVPQVANAGGGNEVGTIKFDLALGAVGGKEMAIREQSMCDGRAKTKIKWNRNANQLRVKAKFKGLPYKPDVCFEEDPSTEFNTYPMCVEDGQWQLWLMGRFFTRTSVYYYDSVSGDLLGNEFDLEAGPPPGSFPVELPTAQMICTDFFESNPHNLKANVSFDFEYDNILDAVDSPGTLVSVIPFNLYDEDSFWVYYTSAILPPEEAMHWDDTLADIDSGLGAVVIATSLEPVPKPPELATHDQLMIGWIESYPDEFITPLPDEYWDDPVCGNEQVSIPFPGGEIPV